VTLASADVANDIKLMGSRLDSSLPTKAAPDAQPSGIMAGRQLTISWNTGDNSTTFSWNRKGPSNDPDKDRLPSPVTEYLSEHCLPHVPNGKLLCFTEIVSVRDDLYPTHPNIYNGGPWNDHAMVKWHKVKALLPAFIHTFIDLRGFKKGKVHLHLFSRADKHESRIVCADSFVSPVDEEDLSLFNTLIGHYTVHRDSRGQRPIMYRVDVESIKSTTSGLLDVGWTPNDHPKKQSEKHRLFLVCRKADWPLAWDSMTDDLADDADDQSIVENKNEKVVGWLMV
jgi:hypothetical protein